MICHVDETFYKNFKGTGYLLTKFLELQVVYRRLTLAASMVGQIVERYNQRIHEHELWKVVERSGGERAAANESMKFASIGQPRIRKIRVNRIGCTATINVAISLRNPRLCLVKGRAAWALCRSCVTLPLPTCVSWPNASVKILAAAAVPNDLNRCGYYYTGVAALTLVRAVYSESALARARVKVAMGAITAVYGESRSREVIVTPVARASERKVRGEP